MAIDKKFIDQFVNVASKAAIASSYFVGKKDKIAADKAAVDSMRRELNKMDIKAEIVIGEGELDEAPMLYIGEKIGTSNGPELDIAVDPLEGTNFTAKNLPNAHEVGLRFSDIGCKFYKTLETQLVEFYTAIGQPYIESSESPKGYLNTLLYSYAYKTGKIERPLLEKGAIPDGVTASDFLNASIACWYCWVLPNARPRPW